MNIIGHQKIIKLLDRSIEKNAVSHAYLFSGPEGVGKFTVALDFAEKLLGKAGVVNPDLIVIKPEIEEKKGIVKKHDIKIEQIRDLQHQLSLTSQSGKYKIAIIDEAERMNKAAQNSLLKNLEEANPGVIMILVAHNEQRLLPTITSRCRKIKFSAVPQKELAEFLGHLMSRDRNDQKTSDVQSSEDIIFWSLGRPGLALDLINNENEMIFRREAERELKQLFSQNAAEKFSIAEDMAKDQKQAAKKLNLWMLLLREAMLGGRKGLVIGNEKALRCIENVRKSLELIQGTNSSPRLVLENLFMSF